MKAIYQSKQKYLQLSKGEVLRSIPVYGMVYQDRQYYKTDKPISRAVRETSRQRTECYIFRLGENNNQLILTDPNEIKCMRGYIQCRKDNLITEVYFEGNDEELQTDSIQVNSVENTTGNVNNSSTSDWDVTMADRMSN